MQNYIVCNLKRFKYLLIPFSVLFRVIVALRRACYRRGIFPVTHIDVPVIIVGNITVGGTGKTPLVIWLANFLKQQGYQPGIVSRGYGGKGATYPCIVTPDSNPLMAGDETVLIARRTGCPVVIDPNRVAAAQFLRKQYPACNIILSDDGLQHYALGRNIEIAVIDGERRFGNGWFLPAGPLREPIERLKTVDFIVTNGQARIGEHSMQLIPDDFHALKNYNEKKSTPDFMNKTLHAVAGIGNPQRFFNMLRSDLGLTIMEHPFPDHHIFTEQDLNFGNDTVIVMTEKDAVKCQNFNIQNSWYIPVKAELSSEFERAVMRKIQTVLK
jgi:tetraacyldisaccharide 4'-kinase